jgi:hypothetical protein
MAPRMLGVSQIVAQIPGDAVAMAVTIGNARSNIVAEVPGGACTGNAVAMAVSIGSATSNTVTMAVKD